MSKEWVFRGKVWVFGDDINTDYMMPGFTPRGLGMKERIAYCMRAIRPEWSKQVKVGDIIIGGRNFGCGSNRPAAEILRLLGLSCLVADSINSLMLRNCVNYVMPSISCPGVSKAFKEGEIMDVNLATGIVKNVTTGEILKTTPLPKFLLDVMEAGGLVGLLEKQGYVEKER